MIEENLNTTEVETATQDEPESGFTGLVRIFRNRFGQWRTVWRILLYIILTGLLMLLFGMVAAAVADSRPGGFISWTGSLTWVAGDLALILAALLILGLFDRRPLALAGLGFSPAWLRELAIGVGAGLASTGLLVIILVATGSVSLEVAANPSASLAALPLLVWTFTVAALLEELLFRGYLMQALAEGSRWWIAALTTTLIFTWAHIDNPDVTLIGVSNIFLAGVILAILYFQTRRLWLPIGLHISWNFAQSWLWGFDVSGIAISDQLLVMTPSDADLITGGEFGLEGSILSTVFFVVAIGWLVWRKSLRPTNEVAAMWVPYPTGFGLGGEIEHVPDREAHGPMIEVPQSKG